MAHAPLWNLNADFEADLTARGELQTVLDLVGRTSLWVDPAVARAVPVVFPKTARIRFGKDRQGQIVDGIRLWPNVPAQEAVFSAMDTSRDSFAGATVCHIYPGSPSSPQHFTRLANLIVVPRPLAAFTEWDPVLAALKRRAFELYGYQGPQEATPPPAPLTSAAWSEPVALNPERKRAVVKRLKHLRRTRPMYSSPRAKALAPWPHPDFLAALVGEPSWASLDAEVELHVLPEGAKVPHPRRLDVEFWDAVLESPPLRDAIVGWIVRHAYFAAPRVVRAVPNPFPRTRRARWWLGEKTGDTAVGVVLGDNSPAQTALLAAFGASFKWTRGGLVDHVWANAAYLAAHNCHLGGLVIVPQALASLVDSPPAGDLLRRHLFERTGYAGPKGKPPPKPAWFPPAWPENRQRTRAQEDLAITVLRRYLREKPQYYRKWKKGGPGRPPRGPQ